MGWIERLRGTASAIFQIGSTGPNLKNNAGAVEVRNHADTDFSVLRLAQPAGDNDGTDRQTFYATSANPNDPYTYAYDRVANYPNSGPFSTREVDYMRVWLPKGRVITKMRCFITGGANAVRQIQFGIYDQASPTLTTGVPNNRVAVTAADTPPNAFTGFRDVNLTASYTVPTSGFYWLAIQADNNAITIALSATYRPGFANRREETPVTFALPNPAGSTTQPQSAIIYVAAVE